VEESLVAGLAIYQSRSKPRKRSDTHCPTRRLPGQRATALLRMQQFLSNLTGSRVGVDFIPSRLYFHHSHVSIPNGPHEGCITHALSLVDITTLCLYQISSNLINSKNGCTVYPTEHGEVIDLIIVSTPRLCFQAEFSESVVFATTKEPYHK